MEIIKGNKRRIIFTEKEVDNEIYVDEIKNIVTNALAALGFTNKVECNIYGECFGTYSMNDWYQCTIESGAFILEFATHSIEPSIVKTENGFEFYFVFEVIGYGCTNPGTWLNARKTPIITGKTAEELVLDYIFE